MLTLRALRRILSAVRQPERAPNSDVFDIWAAYWASQLAHTPPWDFMCETIWRALHATLATYEAPAGRLLEAGCGTGRVSHRLRAEGREAHLIDITAEAIRLSRSLLGEGAHGLFVQGSCFALPYAAGAFDVAWHEGVLEHFRADDQRRFLAEMLRVVRPGGLVVTMNPYARSWLYRLGKAALEALGRWPYGPEYPVRSMAGMAAGAELLGERPVGFLVLLCELFSRLLVVRGGRRLVHRACVWAYRAGSVRWLDRVLARVLGGYLLVSVFRKAGGVSEG